MLVSACPRPRAPGARATPRMPGGRARRSPSAEASPGCSRSRYPSPAHGGRADRVGGADEHAVDLVRMDDDRAAAHRPAQLGILEIVEDTQQHLRRRGGDRHDAAPGSDRRLESQDRRQGPGLLDFHLGGDRRVRRAAESQPFVHGGGARLAGRLTRRTGPDMTTGRRSPHLSSSAGCGAAPTIRMSASASGASSWRPRCARPWPAVRSIPPSGP